jgi:hypothetical protein
MCSARGWRFYGRMFFTRAVLCRGSEGERDAAPRGRLRARASVEPTVTRLHLVCSVCGESQWTEFGVVDAFDLKKLREFYFVCTRHNTSEPD